MKTNWFKKAGWIYVPTSLIGVAITLFVVAFCVITFIGVDRNSHSASDTLYGIFPYYVASFGVLFWIARNSSVNTSTNN